MKEVPQTIRLLASGTSLTLCSFLHCQSSYVNASKPNISEIPTSGLDKCVYNKHWSPLLISVMELLIKSIVRTSKFFVFDVHRFHCIYHYVFVMLLFAINSHVHGINSKSYMITTVLF